MNQDMLKLQKVHKAEIKSILMVGPVENSGGVAIHTKEVVKELRKAGIHVESI